MIRTFSISIPFLESILFLNTIEFSLWRKKITYLRCYKGYTRVSCLNTHKNRTKGWNFQNSSKKIVFFDFILCRKFYESSVKSKKKGKLCRCSTLDDILNGTSMIPSNKSFQFLFAKQKCVNRFLLHAINLLKIVPRKRVDKIKRKHKLFSSSNFFISSLPTLRKLYYF